MVALQRINASNKAKIKTDIQNISRHFADECNCQVFSPVLRLEQRLRTALGA